METPARKKHDKTPSAISTAPIHRQFEEKSWRNDTTETPNARRTRVLDDVVMGLFTSVFTKNNYMR